MKALALRFVKPFLTCFMLLQIPLILFEKKIKVEIYFFPYKQ